MKFKVGTKEFDIDDAKITKAIEDKATEMVLAEDAIVRTKGEDDAFVQNMKKDARKEGLETAIKAYRDEAGLDFTGKNIASLVTAASAKALEEAKLNPDERVTKIETKLKEKESALTAALKRAEDAETTIKQTKSEYKIDRLVDQFIPKNTLLPVEDIKLILKSKMTFKENEEGVVVAYDANGKEIKVQATQDPMGVKEVVEDFFRTNTQYIKPQGGGRGGKDTDDDLGGKITIEKFIENCNEEGIVINSKEYDDKLASLVKADSITVE